MTLFAGICAVLALGPVLKVFDYPTEVFGGISLPGALLADVPGLRIPSRWLGCGLLFLALAAAQSVDRILERRRNTAAVAAIIAAVFLAESWPSPAHVRSSQALPPVETLGVYAALANLGPGPIVELPPADTTGFANPVQSEYVYAIPWHLHPTVSYYASFRPALLDSLTAAAQLLPDAAAEDLLRAHGVRRMVLHRRWMRSMAYDSLAAALEGARYRVMYRASDGLIVELPR